MAWEEIECVKPVNGLDAVPPGGVRINPRRFKGRKGEVRHWIEISLGEKLARKLAMVMPEQRMRLLFGTGAEAGKLGLVVDQEKGKFRAKRRKNGTYALPIAPSSAEGLFAMEFPAFSVIEPEIQRPPHLPPVCVIELSAEMLSVAD